MQAQFEQSAPRDRLQRQQDAMLLISRRWRLSEHEFDQAAATVLEAAALALAVERTSIWLFDDSRSALVCTDLYETTPRTHSRGRQLALADIPAYVDAMKDQEVIRIDDAETDPRAADFYEQHLKPKGVSALLDAPIRYGKDVIGVLCHEHVGAPRRFTDDEADTATFFANLISLAYEFEDRQKAERANERNLALMRAAFEATGAGIIAIDTEGSVMAHNHLVLEMFDMPPSIMGDAGDNGGRARFIADLAVDPDQVIEIWRGAIDDPSAERIDTWEMKDGRWIECTSLPQRIDGHYTGRVWSFRDVTDQRRLEREFREIAVRDTLTGLHNRRWGDEQFAKEIKRADRTQNPLSVALIDIDFFKKVNDLYGHHVGDAVLKALADDFRKRLRATDQPCRWGGEEFLVILPDTDREGAHTVIDELRRVIARERKDLPKFTVSAGVAQYNGQTAEALVSAADARMYEAKQTGRNRVV